MFNLQIFEGPNENSPSVARYCGNRIPPEYSSQTNELMLLFRTDWSFNAEGFRVKYETGWFSIQLNKQKKNKMCLNDFK